MTCSLGAGGCGGRERAAAPAASVAGPAAGAETRVSALPLPEGPLFVDATEASGLDFVQTNGMTGAFYMPENLGSGAALFDWDGDGDLDLFLVQGREIGPEAGTAPTHHTDRLFRNDLGRSAAGASPGGQVRLTDVTAAAGLPPALYGMGVAAGDYDNDGRVDLYVTGFGANRLLRNRADGTFEDVTAAAGVDDPRWSVPAVFFDYDRDGWLDLFVGNYLDFTFANHRPCTTLAGAPDYCDPSAYAGVGDRLFHNLGPTADPASGTPRVTFEDVTAAAGLGGADGKALGAVAFDADGDGWLDLYVANDGTPNNLWMNRGATGAVGTFEDLALLAGCAVNEAGLPEASMGVDAGDPDADGDPDLVMAHFAEETDTFYVNDGTGQFEDRSVPAGIAAPSLEANGFGTAWMDFDADGLLDLLVVNGTVRAVAALLRAGDPYPYHQPNQLFHNLGVEAGQVRFEEVSGRAGAPFARSEVSRGAAVGDLDEDGDPDVVISNSAGPARLLLDVAADGRPWIGVRALARVPTPDGKGEAWRDALGARVGLERDGATTLWRRVGTDGSYASARDPRVLFGLAGPSGKGGAPGALPRRVVVRWPDGTAEAWPAPAAGRYTELRQGSGERLAEAGR